MARAAILREIAGVFDAYKIDVDIRHLELIADYMVSRIIDVVVYRLFTCLTDFRGWLQTLQQKRPFH